MCFSRWQIGGELGKINPNSLYFFSLHKNITHLGSGTLGAAGGYSRFVPLKERIEQTPENEVAVKSFLYFWRQFWGITEELEDRNKLNKTNNFLNLFLSEARNTRTKIVRSEDNFGLRLLRHSRRNEGKINRNIFIFFYYFPFRLARLRRPAKRAWLENRDED